MTNGEPLVVRGAVKPISTLARPLPSADLDHRRCRSTKAHYERSDISVVPGCRRRRRGDGDADARSSFVLEKFGGDTLGDTRDALDRYRAPARAAGSAAAAGPAASDGARLTGTDVAGSGGDD